MRNLHNLEANAQDEAFEDALLAAYRQDFVNLFEIAYIALAAWPLAPPRGPSFVALLLALVYRARGLSRRCAEIEIGGLYRGDHKYRDAVPRAVERAYARDSDAWAWVVRRSRELGFRLGADRDG